MSTRRKGCEMFVLVIVLTVIGDGGSVVSVSTSTAEFSTMSACTSVAGSIRNGDFGRNVQKAANCFPAGD